MKALLLPALVLLAALALPAPAAAHNSTCDAPYVDCIAQCQVTHHIGTPPPHKCALEAPLALDNPVRIQRCPESNQYEITVLGVQVLSCLH